MVSAFAVVPPDPPDFGIPIPLEDGDTAVGQKRIGHFLFGLLHDFSLMMPINMYVVNVC